MRVVIRARGRGPLGFVRLVDPSPPAGGITFAVVRQAISEQLSETFPDESYVFLLEGNVPVAPSQEATEATPEGSTDCYIAFFPAGRALTDASPAARVSNTAEYPPSSQQMLAQQPTRTMVQQWVESFDFMEAREQREAVAYLQMCFPAARAAFAAASSACALPASLAPSSPSARLAAERPPSWAEQHQRQPEARHHRESPLAPAAPTPPRSTASGASPPLRRSLSGAPMAAHWLKPEPKADVAAVAGAADVADAGDGSLDAQLSGLASQEEPRAEEGRGGGEVEADGSTSSLDRQLLALYRSQLGSSTSSLRSGAPPPPAPAAPAANGPPQGAGTAAAARLRGESAEGATPPSSATPPHRRSKFYEETMSSSFRTFEHNQRVSHGDRAGPAASMARGTNGASLNGWTGQLRDSKAPQAHAATSPKRQGRSPAYHEPSPAIAFGSRRPQRPSSASRMPTGAVPHLGRHGSVSGIF